MKLLVVRHCRGCGQRRFWDGLSPGVDVEHRATITGRASRRATLLRVPPAFLRGRPTDTLKIHSATRWLNSDETALGGIQYVTDGNSGEIWDIRASDGVFFEDINELVLTNGVVIDEHAQERG